MWCRQQCVTCMQEMTWGVSKALTQHRLVMSAVYKHHFIPLSLLVGLGMSIEQVCRLHMKRFLLSRYSRKSKN